ncbi:hypothetical protein Zmor_008115 [Zophobas morio]|uniref:Uncharacterized protein n=3 Tax=Zophobas morio TaxID=2755281 RepID=A0AA38J0N9_9CUCU|nr:hypothetical protein Zmor_008115 [Zophobas morio]
MPPTLYMVPSSPPVRAVQITAKALGLKLVEKHLDFQKRENLQPEFLKINPQHTVPTLVDDDGFILWDSHAINAYLVSKYGQSDSLYPQDLKKRAIVDQRLHFDSGVASVRASDVMLPIRRGEKTSLDDNDKHKLGEVYAFLDTFLDGHEWIADDVVTIADYSIYSTVSSSNVFIPIDPDKYPRLQAWFHKVEALPETEVSKPGLRIFAGRVQSRLKQLP